MSGEQNELYRMLGQIQSDIRHVLSGQEKNHQQVAALEERLDKVERFNTRVITYGTIAGTLLMAVFSAATNWLFRMI